MKRRKFVYLLSIVLATSVFLSACTNDTATTPTPTPSASAKSTENAKQAEGEKTKTNKPLKVGVVLTTSGKGDKSFNDSALLGLDKAVADFGVEYKEVQPKDVADIEKSIDFLAKEGYNPVFGIGFTAQGAMNTVGAKYPDTQFIIIDHNYGDKILPNVKSVVFKEEEGSYLAGMLAASQSTSNKISFVGGSESQLIEKFEAGYTVGAKTAKPDIEVLVSYIASDASGFNNPARGKEVALDMISKDVDVIYQAAGGSGVGVLDACAEKSKLAIGVDSNQNWIKPGTVIASMLKRVDIAVYTIIKEKIDNTLKTGDTITYDLKAGGVGLTDLENLTPEETNGISEEDQKKIKALKDTITPETRERIDKAKQGIIDGTIKVPSTVE